MEETKKETGCLTKHFVITFFRGLTRALGDRANLHKSQRRNKKAGGGEERGGGDHGADGLGNLAVDGRFGQVFGMLDVF